MGRTQDQGADGRVIDAACAVVRLSGGTKVAIARDITERKRAEERIKATSEHLRALSARLQAAKEEEDIRIARELHDEMGSTLTSLRWELERLAKLSVKRRLVATPDTEVRGSGDDKGNRHHHRYHEKNCLRVATRHSGQSRIAGGDRNGSSAISNPDRHRLQLRLLAGESGPWSEQSTAVFAFFRRRSPTSCATQGRLGLKSRREKRTANSS